MGFLLVPPKQAFACAFLLLPTVAHNSHSLHFSAGCCLFFLGLRNCRLCTRGERRCGGSLGEAMKSFIVMHIRTHCVQHFCISFSSLFYFWRLNDRSELMKKKRCDSWRIERRLRVQKSIKSEKILIIPVFSLSSNSADSFFLFSLFFSRVGSPNIKEKNRSVVGRCVLSRAPKGLWKMKKSRLGPTETDSEFTQPADEVFSVI